jgi:putative redox protein
MTHTTKVRFEKGMSFEVSLDGHNFKIDADEQFGGTDAGPKPKRLLLAALAGCTGMDVVSILKKMRVNFDEFRLEVEGTLSETEPTVYTSFLINYCFRGKELDREKIEKAVNLSQEKYCGVSAMFRSFAKIQTEIVLNP